MKIEVLYPEFGNLFGDNSNITYLKKCIPDAKIIETAINDEPAFAREKINLIYLGPCTEKRSRNYYFKIASIQGKNKKFD